MIGTPNSDHSTGISRIFGFKPGQKFWRIVDFDHYCTKHLLADDTRDREEGYPPPPF